jgi:hypothetical protein
MKKILTLTLMACLLVSGALAEILPATMQRGMVMPVSRPNNPVIQEVSSTTGLAIDPNRAYAPILMTVDNNQYALPHWGIDDADIMYELPIQSQGWTRLVALFSDKYPQEAGPVRSARVLHLDLNEEWGGAMCHYGQQEKEGSDVNVASREYGLAKKGLKFDGIAERNEKYFVRVNYHPAPHNVSLFVDKLYSEEVAPLNYMFTPRPFLFTDEKPAAGRDVNSITITHDGNKDTQATYSYNPERNSYMRSTTVKGAYLDLKGNGTPVEYSNIIVQRTRLTYNKSTLAPLLPDVVGSGAAEIFMGGKYIAGSWSRASMRERTIFYDDMGNEIALQRGKSWICLAPESTSINVE